MSETKKTGEEVEIRDGKGQFVEGHPPIEGAHRPKGKRDFETDFNEAVKEFAEKQGITLGEARASLLTKGFMEARKGDYKFWQYIHDQLYGKPDQNLGFNGDITVIVKRGDTLDNDKD